MSNSFCRRCQLAAFYYNVNTLYSGKNHTKTRYFLITYFAEILKYFITLPVFLKFIPFPFLLNKDLSILYSAEYE